MPGNAEKGYSNIYFIKYATLFQLIIYTLLCIKLQFLVFHVFHMNLLYIIIEFKHFRLFKNRVRISVFNIGKAF